MLGSFLKNTDLHGGDHGLIRKLELRAQISDLRVFIKNLAVVFNIRIRHKKAREINSLANLSSICPLTHLPIFLLAHLPIFLLTYFLDSLIFFIMSILSPSLILSGFSILLTLAIASTVVLYFFATFQSVSFFATTYTVTAGRVL